MLNPPGAEPLPLVATATRRWPSLPIELQELIVANMADEELAYFARCNRSTQALAHATFSSKSRQDNVLSELKKLTGRDFVDAFLQSAWTLRSTERSSRIPPDVTQSDLKRLGRATTGSIHRPLEPVQYIHVAADRDTTQQTAAAARTIDALQPIPPLTSPQFRAHAHLHLQRFCFASKSLPRFSQVAVMTIDAQQCSFSGFSRFVAELPRAVLISRADLYTSDLMIDGPCRPLPPGQIRRLSVTCPPSFVMPNLRLFAGAAIQDLKLDLEGTYAPSSAPSPRVPMAWPERLNGLSTDTSNLKFFTPIAEQRWLTEIRLIGEDIGTWLPVLAQMSWLKSILLRPTGERDGGAQLRMALQDTGFAEGLERLVLSQANLRNARLFWPSSLEELVFSGCQTQGLKMPYPSNLKLLSIAPRDRAHIVFENQAPDTAILDYALANRLRLTSLRDEQQEYE